MSEDILETEDGEFINQETGEVVEEEIVNLMTNFDVDQEVAEKAQELMEDLDLDEDIAVELAEEL
ncbi:MAG: hypothetical protein WCO35_02380 [Candidatus Nomurabacteria bacterium]